MTAQRDGSTPPPVVPDHRWARRLFLIGVLVAAVPLLMLVVARGSAHDSASSVGTPGGGTGTSAGRGVATARRLETPMLPPDSLPGDSAEENGAGWEADDLRERARDVLAAPRFS